MTLLKLIWYVVATGWIPIDSNGIGNRRWFDVGKQLPYVFNGDQQLKDEAKLRKLKFRGSVEALMGGYNWACSHFGDL